MTENDIELLQLESRFSSHSAIQEYLPSAQLLEWGKLEYSHWKSNAFLGSVKPKNPRQNFWPRNRAFLKPRKILIAEKILRMSQVIKNLKFSNIWNRFWHMIYYSNVHDSNLILKLGLIGLCDFLMLWGWSIIAANYMNFHPSSLHRQFFLKVKIPQLSVVTA